MPWRDGRTAHRPCFVEWDIAQEALEMALTTGLRLPDFREDLGDADYADEDQRLAA